MSKYQVFVDLGTSGSKAVLVDPSKGYGYYAYLCSPKVADLPPSELQILRQQETHDGGGLESGAYLQLGESAYALAEDAEGRSNKTTAMLRKSALAQLRILGLIGEMAHRLKTPHLSIDLGVALPFEEYLSAQAEIVNLLAPTKPFIYRGQTIDLEIHSIKVLPEGAGLVMWRKVLATQRQEPSQQNYIVVMIGYRDLSFLVFRQGKPPTGEPSGSVKLGYLEFLKSIAQGMCQPESPYLFDALLLEAKSVKFPNQPNKVFPLTELRQKSESFYWEQVRYHLSEKLATLDLPRYEVLVGGGTAMTLLHSHLAEYLPTLPGATINWLPELNQEIIRTVKGINSTADRVRFADCYGGAKWLASRNACFSQTLTGVSA